MERSPTVLVVDDEESILKLLRVNLSLAGYQVVTASDGMAALRLLEEYKPDLIILDLMMPDLDGYQVLQLIRQKSRVPIIIISVKDDAFSVRRALVAGADDYVAKPFSLLELSARIRAKLRRTTAGSLRKNLEASTEDTPAPRHALWN